MDKESAIYKKALKMANDEYGEKSSIYRSSRIVSLYKKFGGRITKNSPKKGLTRWFKEKWVQVVPYLENKTIIECGGKRVSKSPGKSCRPLYRITKDTPITIDELLKLHNRNDIIKVAKSKERSPSKRIIWKTLSE
jgi:Family of unknown function (DUF5872)